MRVWLFERIPNNASICRRQSTTQFYRWIVPFQLLFPSCTALHMLLAVEIGRPKDQPGQTVSPYRNRLRVWTELRLPRFECIRQIKCSRRSSSWANLRYCLTWQMAMNKVEDGSCPAVWLDGWIDGGSLHSGYHQFVQLYRIVSQTTHAFLKICPGGHTTRANNSIPFREIKLDLWSSLLCNTVPIPVLSITTRLIHQATPHMQRWWWCRAVRPRLATLTWFILYCHSTSSNICL